MPTRNSVTGLPMADMDGGVPAGEYPPAKGDLSTREAFRMTLWALYGPRSDGDFAYEDPRVSCPICADLRRDEVHLQWREATSTILNAIRDGMLQLFASIGSDVRRITGDQLPREDLEKWESYFFQSEMFTPLPPELPWAHEARLSVLPEEVTDLVSSVARFGWPGSVIKRDPSVLEGAYTSLSMTLTWLACGKPVDSFALIKRRATINSIVEKARKQHREKRLHDHRLLFVMDALAEHCLLNDARRILLAELENGAIVAIGGESEDAPLEPTPRHVFAVPRFLNAEGDAIEVDMTASIADFEAGRPQRYVNVRLETAALADRFGLPDREFDQSTLDRAYSKPHRNMPRYSPSKVYEAYKERVATWPEDLAPPSRDDDVNWARMEFGCPREAVRELRRELAPPEWKQGGRRRAKKTWRK